MRLQTANRIPSHATRPRFAALLGLACTLACLGGCVEKDREVFRSKSRDAATKAVYWLHQYGGHPVPTSSGDARNPIWVVSVPAAEQIPALGVLHELGVLSEGDATPPSSQMWRDPTEAQLQALRTRQNDLASQIRMLPGVVNALVSLVPPAKDPMRRGNAPEPQASVTLTYVGEADPASLRESAKNVVLRGAEGIADAERVCVVLTKLQPTPINAAALPTDDSASTSRLKTVNTALMSTTLVLLGLCGFFLTPYWRRSGAKA